MAENKPLKAREKTVQQMTRSGLIQQNRATGEVERVSQRTEDFSLQSHPAVNEDFTRRAGASDSRQPLNHSQAISHAQQPVQAHPEAEQSYHVNDAGAPSYDPQNRIHSDAQALSSVPDGDSTYSSQHSSPVQNDFQAGRASHGQPDAARSTAQYQTHESGNGVSSPSAASLYHGDGERLSESPMLWQESHSPYQESAPATQQHRFAQAHFSDTQDDSRSSSVQAFTQPEAYQPQPYESQPYSPQPYTPDVSDSSHDTQADSSYQPAPSNQAGDAARWNHVSPSVSDQNPVSAPAVYHSPAASSSFSAYAAAALETHGSHRQEKKTNAYHEQTGQHSYQTEHTAQYEQEHHQTAYHEDHTQAGNTHFRQTESGASPYQSETPSQQKPSQQNASFHDTAPDTPTPTQDMQSQRHVSAYREESRTAAVYQTEASSPQESAFHSDMPVSASYRVQQDGSHPSSFQQDGFRQAAGQAAPKTEHSVPFSASNSGTPSPRMDFEGTPSAQLSAQETLLPAPQKYSDTDNGIDIYHRSGADPLMSAQRPQPVSLTPSVSTTPHYGFHDDGAVSAFHIDAGSGSDSAYQPDKPQRSAAAAAYRQGAGASEDIHHLHPASSGENFAAPSLQSSPGEAEKPTTAKSADSATPLHQKQKSAAPLTGDILPSIAQAAPLSQIQHGIAGDDKPVSTASTVPAATFIAAAVTANTPATAEQIPVTDNGITLNHRQDATPVLPKENIGQALASTTEVSTTKVESRRIAAKEPVDSVLPPKKKRKQLFQQSDTAPDSPTVPSAEPAAKDNGIALNHRQDTAPILPKENLGRAPVTGAKGAAQDAAQDRPTAPTHTQQKKGKRPLRQSDAAPNSPAASSAEPAAKDNGIALNQRQSAVSPAAALEHRQELKGKRKSGTALARQTGQELSSKKKDAQRLDSKEGAPSEASASSAGASRDKKGKAKNTPSRSGIEKDAAPPASDTASPSKASKAPDAKAGKSSGQGKAKASSLPTQGESPSPSDAKSAKKKKQQQESAKKTSKLKFEKSDLSGESGVTGKVKAASEKAAHAVTGTVGTYVHGKIHEVEHENSGVEAAHRTELLAERGFSEASQRLKAHSQAKKQQKKVSRLRESSTENKSRLHMGSPATDEAKKASQTKKSSLSKFYQKMQNKRRATEAAKAAKQGKKAAESTAEVTVTVTERVVSWFKEVFVTRKKTWIAILALLFILILLVTQLQSCSTIALQTLGTVTASSWPADDAEITKAENYYTQLEANLQKKINTVESRNSGCDEYSYNLDEIGHDPVVLISYLCAKYGDFTFDSTIQNELDTLFTLQYSYSEPVATETRTTTKTVRVGESLGEVVTSGYCNCSICCGIWAGGTTASGVYPQANHTIAVDASNPIVPIGTKVVMNGIEYTVEDTGNFARYGVDFDVYYDSHSAASAHGHQIWTAYLSDANGDTEVEVTTTSEVKVCYVTLSTTSMETLVASRLDEEQTELYTVYVSTRGNRQFLGTPVDYSWHYYVSSYYGYRVTSSNSIEMHNGLDISVPEGTEILSVTDGTVTTASYSSSYGNYLIVENDDGYWVLYAHCKTLKVSAGDEVTTGDVIATVGSTGTTTGTHLHIEFQYDGAYYNPYFYLAEGSATLYDNAAYPSDAAAKLIAKAKMYLGTPYVWGGYSPSGFDCSGFVSYSINNCGAGWNVGRLTANGLLGICTVIPASEAKAGDLIFFQGTYSTSGASHVGIYLGDGTMIHAGDPVKISSISTSYWQSHFLCYGRLPTP